MALTQQIPNYDEFIVGKNHPTLADTVSRAFLKDHDQFGAHLRLTTAQLTNVSGAQRVTGDVVVLASGTDMAVTTTTVEADRTPVRIVQSTMDNNTKDYVAESGIVTDVKVTGVVARLDYLITSTTAARAKSGGTFLVSGVFGIALTAAAGPGDGTVKAIIFGFTFDQRIPVLAKTAAYTLTVADRGRLIDATSGTWTLSLPAAATAGDGFWFAVRNSGSGTITIDPDAAEQIDGAATLTRLAGETVSVVCNGSAWKTLARVASGVTGTGISKIELVRKTVDEIVNNSTTLQNDDVLKVALAANEAASFLFQIFSESSAVADIQYAITVPAGATLIWSKASGVGVSPTGGVQPFTTITASGTAQADVGAGAGDKRAVTIIGTVVNGATAGDLQLQWAQNTAEVSDTKVFANSILLAFRV